MKTKEELLSNATNEHDRELMRKELDKFDKKLNKIEIIIFTFLFLSIIFLISIELGGLIK